MRGAAVAIALALSAATAGCVENTAPGNDREAELDAPESPASVASAAEALSGVATGLLLPEIMSDADRGAAPSVGGEACLFRMTEVGFPVLLYGSSAVVKLNGRLVPLPGTGEGRYSDAGVEATVRPLDGDRREARQFPAEFVLRLPGAPDELGFHGYGECGR